MKVHAELKMRETLAGPYRWPLCGSHAAYEITDDHTQVTCRKCLTKLDPQPQTAQQTLVQAVLTWHGAYVRDWAADQDREEVLCAAVDAYQRARQQ